MNEERKPSMQDRKPSTQDIAAAGRGRSEQFDTGAAAAARAPEPSRPLFPDAELQGYRSRWDSIQTSFVDEPRRAVEQADALVAETVKRLAESFTQESAKLEAQWSRGGDVSTEDLRQAIQRYRTFFDRLLRV